jgi:hypothetical protein
VPGSRLAGVHVPLLLTIGGQHLDSWTFRPACAHPKREFSEKRHVDRTRAGHCEGLFPSFDQRASHPRDAGEQRREKTGRSIARTTGREDKRSACSKRGKRPRVVIEGARKSSGDGRNGCRAHGHETSPRVSSRRAKVFLAGKTRTFHEVRCANRSWSNSNVP